MDVSKRRCGECGERQLAAKNVRGKYQTPWRDFPVVFVTCDLELWECGHCGNHVQIGGDGAKIDAACEQSVRDQAAQFIDVIRSKTGITSGQLAECLGVSPQHLSSVHSGKFRPSFSLWNFLKTIATDPVAMLRRVAPTLDVVQENILLHV